MKPQSVPGTRHHSRNWVRYFYDDLPLYAVPRPGFEAHTPIQAVFKLLQCWVGVIAFKILVSQYVDPASLRNKLYVLTFPSLEQTRLRLILCTKGFVMNFPCCFLWVSDISHLPFIAPCSQLQIYLSATLRVVKWPTRSLLTSQTPCFPRFPRKTDSL